MAKVKRDYDPNTGDALGPEEDIPNSKGGKRFPDISNWSKKYKDYFREGKDLYMGTGKGGGSKPLRGRKLLPTLQKGSKAASPQKVASAGKPRLKYE